MRSIASSLSFVALRRFFWKEYPLSRVSPFSEIALQHGAFSTQTFALSTPCDRAGRKVGFRQLTSVFLARQQGGRL